MNDCAGSGEASVSASGDQAAPCKEAAKKKRNLPGMPDPNAEVVALSPKTLLATNRFVCEICNKGFQRDQNLQLHRRGHNLPWKLRQRTSNEVRKRVYVCPEPTCVHHDPSRALGDLTGIKKHFCRKHGEKKWKCDKCSKKYAVQSDLKAHLKICGTKEYKCDCGTMFSRRDSFITHRAFCDVLAKDSEKAQNAVTTPITDEDCKVQVVVSSTPPTPPTPPPASEPSAVPSPAAPEPLPPPFTPSTAVVSSDSPIQNPELAESPRTNSNGTITKQDIEETTAKSRLSGICSSSSCTGCTNSNCFTSLTGICSSSLSSSSNGSTSSSSIFPSLTRICSSTRSSSSNGSTGSISVFPSLSGIFSNSRNSNSNGSTRSSSIFSSSTGICSSSSSIFASSTGIYSSSSSSSSNRSNSSSSIFTSLTGICSSSSNSSSNGSASNSTFASLFASSTASGSLPSQAPQFTDWFQSVAPAPPPDIEPPSSMEPISLCLAMSHGSSVFGPTGQERMQYAAAPQPSMSATALLQKAAQMGATATNSSLLRGLGILSSSSSSSGQHEWNGRQIDTDGATLAAGLGLGLPCDDGSGLKELMLGTPSVFGPKHPTLDLLGLGMAAGGGPTPGLSALITSMGGNLDVAAAAGSFDSGEFCGKEFGRSS
ncbi:zinc finger protein ENHYDROUS-like [Solanum dulcamara]|uniref:zinc finger protein ENHYDROUS-like n=1 Tax=Solanum dulcamara TaxID=45834 RepID=UPI0024855BB7|nr:zinc finger protein ENHYDROUS-like [Solanum dulcamara]